jgi:hypothetical protein
MIRSVTLFYFNIRKGIKPPRTKFSAEERAYLMKLIAYFGDGDWFQNPPVPLPELVQFGPHFKVFSHTGIGIFYLQDWIQGILTSHYELRCMANAEEARNTHESILRMLDGDTDLAERYEKITRNHCKLVQQEGFYKQQLNKRAKRVNKIANYETALENLQLQMNDPTRSNTELRIEINKRRMQIYELKQGVSAHEDTLSTYKKRLEAQRRKCQRIGLMSDIPDIPYLHNALWHVCECNWLIRIGCTCDSKCREKLQSLMYINPYIWMWMCENIELQPIVQSVAFTPELRRAQTNEQILQAIDNAQKLQPQSQPQDQRSKTLQEKERRAATKYDESRSPDDYRILAQVQLELARHQQSVKDKQNAKIQRESGGAKPRGEINIAFLK